MITRDAYGNELSLEELLAKAEIRATPIDFNFLESTGIIEKHGTWYRVLDHDRFPQAAAEKICGVMEDGFVQFRQVTREDLDLLQQLRQQLRARDHLAVLERSKQSGWVRFGNTNS